MGHGARHHESPRDFKTLGYIFSHLKVEPRPGYIRRRKTVGERGAAVAYVIGTACPMHHIMKELMPLEQFFFALHDGPENIQRLAQEMEPYYAQMRQLAADSEAEVVFLGGNYDDSITYPRFFEAHILPPLSDYARVAAQARQVPDDSHRRREPPAGPALPARRFRHRGFPLPRPHDPHESRRGSHSIRGPHHDLGRYPLGAAVPRQCQRIAISGVGSTI